MATSTTNYSFDKPTVGGESDAWGALLNANWDSLDALLSGTGSIDGPTLINATLSGTGNTVNANAGTLDGMTVTDTDVTANRLESENEIKEGEQTATGTTPTINPSSGGTIVTWTLTAGVAHTPTFTLNAGEFVTLLITAGTGTVTWPAGFQWINGAPVLASSGVNVIEVFKSGTVVFAAYVGNT